MAIINVSRQLKEILAEAPTLTGTVTAINTDGTSTITMTGGGTLIALGVTVAVGKVAYIKDQVIVGESQSLTLFSLDV
jgi:ATP:corrinoid adenosyltransferase